MSFVFVSAKGSDATERGPVMWARVKGRTENALMRMPFRSVHVLRPAIVIPLHGITSRTRSYRLFYAVSRPLLPLLKAVFPRYVTTTEQMGRAMLRLVRHGHRQPVLEAADIAMLRLKR